MITLHKVIKLIAENNDIKLITRQNTGKKHILLVKGFASYCFISEEQEHLLDNNNYVSRVYDDGFRNFWNAEPMSLVKFQHPSNVGRERYQIGPQILHQADVHYELACAVFKQIGRYIRINGNLKNPMIYVDQIYPMNLIEIEETNFNDYNKVRIDIEVLSEDDETSMQESIKEAQNQVISIVTTSDKESIAWVFGNTSLKKVKNKLFDKIATVHTYNTETDLLESCYDYVNRFDVAIEWSTYDGNYLENRSNNLNLKIDWRTIQWFDLMQGVAKNQKFTTSYLKLKTVFDELYLYKRHSWKHLPPIFQNYFSEEEGKNEEDKGKGIATLNKESMIYKYIQFRKTQSGSQVKELYESQNFKSLLFYNACDVWDMVMLEKVGGVDSYLNLFDGLQLMRVNDVFIHTSRIEPLALKFCMMNKVASPSKLVQEGIVKEGAIVHDQIRGRVLKNVIVLDYSRFYVSIIIAKNISPENKGSNPQKMFTIKPNGEEFDEPMFFLPGLALYLIEQRNQAETNVLEATDTITKEYWKTQAFALKETTSGLWGYIAKNGDVVKNKNAGRYYSKHVPNDILQESRSKNIELKNYVEKTKFDGVQYKAVAGDSDSVFIEESNSHQNYLDINPNLISEKINTFLINLCEKQGYTYPITANAEKMYDRLVLVSKKYYYGRVVWENGKFLDIPRYDIKGMQSKRSDHSQLAKDFQHSIITNHLDKGMKGVTQTIQKMNKFISHGFKIKTNDFVESIAIPWRIKKHIGKKPKGSKKEYYESGVWKYWSDSAVKWNEYIESENLGEEYKLKINTKVFIIIIKYCNIKTLKLDNKYLVFPQANLIDWSKIQIDEDAMENKTVKEKIDNIMKSLGKEKNVIESLSKGRATQIPKF